MADNEGHFEKGRWVEEKETTDENAAGPGNAGAEGSIDDFDEKIAELRSSVSKNLGDIFGIGKALVTTEEGRDHLAKKMKKAEEKIDKTIGDFAESFEKIIKK